MYKLYLSCLCAALLMVVAVSCGGGGSIVIDPPPVVPLDTAPEIARLDGDGVVMESSKITASESDELILHIWMQNDNDPLAEIESVLFCIKHDPNEDNPLTAAEALGLCEQGAGQYAGAEVYSFPYERVADQFDIDSYLGAPFTRDSRYWISAVFKAPDDGPDPGDRYSPASAPQRFKILPSHYPFVYDPAIGPIKLFSGVVNDAQGPLADCLVEFWYHGVYWESGYTDDDGYYEFRIQIQNPTGTSMVRSVSRGEVDYTTDYLLTATPAGAPGSAQSKYLDPEYTSYDVDFSFNLPPVALLTADPTSGEEGTLVTLDASASYDSDGSVVQYDYDYDGDGTWDFINGGAETTHVYLASGVYNPVVRVHDNLGATGVSSGTMVTIGQQYWETESNDTAATADLMPVSYHPALDDRDFTGAINSAVDEDWYRVDINTDDYYAVTFMACSLNLPATESLTLALYDDALNLRHTTTFQGGDVCDMVRHVNGDPTYATYYLRVTGSAAGADYELTFQQIHRYIAGENFFETEPNNNSGTADLLPLNYDPDTDAYTYTGIFTSGDTSADWYRYDVTASGYVVMQVMGYDYASNEYVTVQLYDSAMNVVESATLGYNHGAVVLHTLSAVPAGSYYLSISPNTWTHRYNVQPNHFIP